MHYNVPALGDGGKYRLKFQKLTFYDKVFGVGRLLPLYTKRLLYHVSFSYFFYRLADLAGQTKLLSFRLKKVTGNPSRLANTTGLQIERFRVIVEWVNRFAGLPILLYKFSDLKH